MTAAMQVTVTIAIMGATGRPFLGGIRGSAISKSQLFITYHPFT